MTIIIPRLHPRKTRTPKLPIDERKEFFQTMILGIHVSFRGCRSVWNYILQVVIHQYSPLIFPYLLGQWLNFKLFGITYLVGNKPFKLFFFQGPGRLSELLTSSWSFWNRETWKLFAFGGFFQPPTFAIWQEPFVILREFPGTPRNDTPHFPFDIGFF